MRKRRSSKHPKSNGIPHRQGRAGATAKRFKKKQQQRLETVIIIRPGVSIYRPGHESVNRSARGANSLCLSNTHLPLCHVVNCADCLGMCSKAKPLLATVNVIDSPEVPVSRYVSEIRRAHWPVLDLAAPPLLFGFSVARLASLATERWPAFNSYCVKPSLLNPAGSKRT